MLVGAGDERWVLDKEALSWSGWPQHGVTSEVEGHGQWGCVPGWAAQFTCPFALRGDQVPCADSWVQMPPYAMGVNTAGVAPGDERISHGY